MNAVAGGGRGGASLLDPEDRQEMEVARRSLLHLGEEGDAPPGNNIINYPQQLVNLPNFIEIIKLGRLTSCCGSGWEAEGLGREGGR